MQDVHQRQQPRLLHLRNAQKAFIQRKKQGTSVMYMYVPSGPSTTGVCVHNYVQWMSFHMALMHTCDSNDSLVTLTHDWEMYGCVAQRKYVTEELSETVSSRPAQTQLNLKNPLW